MELECVKSSYSKGESMELHLQCIEDIKQLVCFCVCLRTAGLSNTLSFEFI